MRFCPNCRTRYDNAEDYFCGKCGFKLIDKLPETGFVVGMILPVPFMSVILTSLGIAIKYSYKTCKLLKEKETHKLNKLV